MRKNYAYLLFALFLAFSACQEDVIESTSNQNLEIEDATTFTFVYKGKTYLEAHFSPDAPFQNTVIEEVMSTDTYSTYIDPENENTIYLFDSGAEAERFFNTSPSNARTDCNTSDNLVWLTFFSERNYEHPYPFQPWSTSSKQNLYDNNPREYWSFYRIDNYPSTSIPCSRNVPDMGSFDNDANAIKLHYFGGSTVESNYRKAVLVVYELSNYGGRSRVWTRDLYRGLSDERDLTNVFLPPSSTWRYKISSFKLYFEDR